MSLFVSSPSPLPLTFVNLVGTVEGNNIIIEHRGGEALSLDTKVIITIGDEIENITIGDSNYLDDEAKIDKKWNVGERLVYPFEYNLSCRKAEIKAMDKKSNSLIIIGTLDISPECDIGLKLTVDEQLPKIGDTINLTIRATSYRGDIDASVVKIYEKLPDDLTYQSHFTTNGNYDPDTGIWDITKLLTGGYVNLNIKAVVTSAGTINFTQLAILLDGSGSINSDDWNITKQGLADAIESTFYFPHDGSVELTVIQFGGDPTPLAQVEIGPIIVTDDNYKSVANDIKNMSQLEGATPMACAIYLAADTLAASPHFDVNIRQVINLGNRWGTQLYM